MACDDAPPAEERRRTLCHAGCARRAAPGEPSSCGAASSSIPTSRFVSSAWQPSSQRRIGNGMSEEACRLRVNAETLDAAFADSKSKAARPRKRRAACQRMNRTHDLSIDEAGTDAVRSRRAQLSPAALSLDPPRSARIIAPASTPLAHGATSARARRYSVRCRTGGSVPEGEVDCAPRGGRVRCCRRATTPRAQLRCSHSSSGLAVHAA